MLSKERHQTATGPLLCRLVYLSGAPSSDIQLDDLARGVFRGPHYRSISGRGPLARRLCQQHIATSRLLRLDDCDDRDDLLRLCNATNKDTAQYRRTDTTCTQYTYNFDWPARRQVKGPALHFVRRTLRSRGHATRKLCAARAACRPRSTGRPREGFSTASVLVDLNQRQANDKAQRPKANPASF